MPVAKNEDLDLSSMKWATLFLMILSSMVFLVQRLVRVFDPVFEICVFYLSTTVSIAMYLWKRKNLR